MLKKLMRKFKKRKINETPVLDWNKKRQYKNPSIVVLQYATSRHGVTSEFCDSWSSEAAFKAYLFVPMCNFSPQDKPQRLN